MRGPNAPSQDRIGVEGYAGQTSRVGFARGLDDARCASSLKESARSKVQRRSKWFRRSNYILHDLRSRFYGLFAILDAR